MISDFLGILDILDYFQRQIRNIERKKREELVALNIYEYSRGKLKTRHLSAKARKNTWPMRVEVMFFVDAQKKAISA